MVTLKLQWSLKNFNHLFKGNTRMVFVGGGSSSHEHRTPWKRWGSCRCPVSSREWLYNMQPEIWTPARGPAAKAECSELGKTAVTEDWWNSPRPLNPRQERNFQEPAYLGNTAGQVSSLPQTGQGRGVLGNLQLGNQKPKLSLEKPRVFKGTALAKL